MGTPDRDVTVGEAVRDALGMPDQASPLDQAHRNRIRQRVLALAPLRPRLSDRSVAFLAALGTPGPLVLRALVTVVVLAGLLAGVAVASADSLPDEPLYGAKLAAEQLRLALAVTPEDRASVELSIAEHRLAEAERLAAGAASESSESSAVVAASAYAAHVANAAAEIAEVLPPKREALLEQVEARVEEQRARAGAVADRLAKDPARAPAAAPLATIAKTPRATAANRPARIAEDAAEVGKRLAADAAERARKPKEPKERAAEKGPTPQEAALRSKASAEKGKNAHERAKRAADKVPSRGGRGRD